MMTIWPPPGLSGRASSIGFPALLVAVLTGDDRRRVAGADVGGLPVRRDGDEAVAAQAVQVDPLAGGIGGRIDRRQHAPGGYAPALRLRT